MRSILTHNVELTGTTRQDTHAGTQTMYRVPAARRVWPAVAGPVERPVRRRLRVEDERAPTLRAKLTFAGRRTRAGVKAAGSISGACTALTE